MGGKQDIAFSLIMAMHRKKPQATKFYDLFGGGGSVSFMALQFGYDVYYNEIQAGICNLIEFLKTNKVPDEWWTWVCRKKFFEHIGKTDPYSQMVALCYSFGNNCVCYAFGEEYEHLKRLGHEVVVHDCDKSRQKLGIPKLKQKTIKGRRLELAKHIQKVNKNDRGLAPLQYLEQVQRLQQLEQLEQLNITNKDYKDVNIIGDDVIVYLDPPYRGTAKYNSATKDDGYSINHKELDEWFLECPHTAFMSEYNAPHNAILEIDKKALLSATSNSKTIKEKLYWNGK